MKPSDSQKTECADKLRRAMRTAGLKEVRFNFDFEGTKLITS